MSGAGGPATIHATALILGEAGILIRGPSGAGKSTLARTLLGRAERDGRFARVVADDRVILTVRAGRLVARPHPAVSGRLEIRGLGLVSVPFEAHCVVRLVVDLREDAPRMPAENEREVCLLGVALPLVQAAPRDAESLIDWQLRVPDDTIVNAD